MQTPRGWMRAVWEPELHTKMLGGIGGSRSLFLLDNLQKRYLPVPRVYWDLTNYRIQIALLQRTLKDERNRANIPWACETLALAWQRLGTRGGGGGGWEGHTFYTPLRVKKITQGFLVNSIFFNFKRILLGNIDIIYNISFHWIYYIVAFAVCSYELVNCGRELISKVWSWENFQPGYQLRKNWPSSRQPDPFSNTSKSQYRKWKLASSGNLTSRRFTELHINWPLIYLSFALTFTFKSISRLISCYLSLVRVYLKWVWFVRYPSLYSLQWYIFLLGKQTDYSRITECIQIKSLAS